MTSRELETVINDIADRYESSERTLDQYLSALLLLVRGQSNSDSFSVDTFVGLLSDAFTAEPFPFREDWRSRYDSFDEDAPGFAGWEATIIRQIVDLREMDEAGTLKNEYRYFGVDAPGRSRWYNFDPASFIECGLAGVLDGWDLDDSPGSEQASTQVGLPAAAGEVVSADPEVLDLPVFEVPEVSWYLFRKFIVCGQIYE